MSFLKPLAQNGLFGLGGMAVAGSPGHDNGGLFNANPAGIANFGKAMNGIATAGGATPGYDASTAPPIANHLQMLDPGIQAALAKFRNTPIPMMGNYQ